MLKNKWTLSPELEQKSKALNRPQEPGPQVQSNEWWPEVQQLWGNRQVDIDN